MFGSPDFTAVLVLVGLFAAVLLALLSYHTPRRDYVNIGLGILILATSLALLIGAFGTPSVATALVLVVVFFAIMAMLMTYQNRAWAHTVWWIGVTLFLLSLPLLAVGRGDLAVFALIAGPGLLMLVATLFPEVPARYSRIGVTDAPPQVTSEEIAVEPRRYTRLAGGITLAAIAGVWLFGGVPRAPVEAQAIGPVTFDERLAQQGAVLFQEYGCVACHSVTGQAGLGPTLQGAAYRTRRLADGTVQAPTEEYLRQSIAQPNDSVVNGFASGVMLTAVGPRLPEITQPSNLDALINYIKSLTP
ncbi:MAG: cytochrome c [Chloroflexota bacterium]|nr:cytochrome c [Chloroflexota bacterium]